MVIERGRLVVDGPREAVLQALKNKSLKTDSEQETGGTAT